MEELPSLIDKGQVDLFLCRLEVVHNEVAFGGVSILEHEICVKVPNDLRLLGSQATTDFLENEKPNLCCVRSEGVRERETISENDPLEVRIEMWVDIPLR